MAYIRPIVQVYQEYETLSSSAQSAALNACIVGPCYQVMNETLNTESALLRSFLGAYTPAGLVATQVPNIIAGAELDPLTVKVRFTQAYVSMEASSKVVTTITGNMLTFAVNTYPTGIAIGDFVTVKAGDGTVLADKYAVINVDAAAFKVYLNRTVTTGTSPAAHWLQAVPEFTLTDESTAVTVTPTTKTVAVSSVTVLVNAVSKTLFEAKMYCGYKALRQDVTGLITVASVDEIETKLGEIIPENPLAYGAMITLANTTTSIYTVGVPSVDTAGYTSAKDVLENVSDVYSIVPLTQDIGIQGLFKIHATSMSDPAKSTWRIVFGNSPLPNEVTLASGACIVKMDTGDIPKLVFSSGANFKTQGIKSGDSFNLTNTGGTIVKVLVSSVVSEDTLIVSAAVTGVTVDSVSYNFTVSRTADKQLQAQDIAKTSSTWNSSRFYNVWPDVCVIDGVALPGYYICCALAGMTAGLPSQQGYTRISIGAISGVKHSSDYFNSTQLDIIADGGTMVLMQENPTAAPYVRHQLSTDQSTYEMGELSFVKNFDYVSYACKDTLDNFIGQYNVTPSTLGILETSLVGTLEYLKTASVAKIGAPILNYNQPVIAQSATTPSSVSIYVQVSFPYALNMIGLHLVSSTL